MPRISEHIDHHARRIAQRTKDKVQKHPLRLLILLIILVAMLAGAYLYLQEAKQVREQDIASPISCARLRFPTNTARCEQMLIGAYSTLHGLEREPLCNRTRLADRPGFGSAAQLCEEYDDALAAQIYGTTLQDRGIAPWEPERPVLATGALQVRTLDAISSLSIVCGGVLVESNWTGNGTMSTLIFSPQDSAESRCVLVARIAAGSITSDEFTIIRRPGNFQ